MMIAITVAETMEISIAPLTFSTCRAISSPSPTTNTRMGQPVSEPEMPSSTGGEPAGLRTTPALTSPTKAMNRPMPTEIAVRRVFGTALNTAVRNPVSTRTAMRIPSQTTSPMACGQVICGTRV